MDIREHTVGQVKVVIQEHTGTRERMVIREYMVIQEQVDNQSHQQSKPHQSDARYADSKSFSVLTNVSVHPFSYFAAPNVEFFLFAPDGLFHRTFKTKEIYKKHVNSAHKKRYPCKYCGKQYSSRADLVCIPRFHICFRPWMIGWNLNIF